MVLVSLAKTLPTGSGQRVVGVLAESFKLAAPLAYVGVRFRLTFQGVHWGWAELRRLLGLPALSLVQRLQIWFGQSLLPKGILRYTCLSFMEPVSRAWEERKKSSGERQAWSEAKLYIKVIKKMVRIQFPFV